jgi:hypothetical protein
VILNYDQLIEASRLTDEWEDNMETKFSEPTAQIARKQKNSKDYRKQ